MSYDIVLVMIPPWEPKMPPLGLAYIAEYLSSRGLNPKVLDFNLRLYRNVDNDRRLFWDMNCLNLMFPLEIADSMYAIFRREIDALVEEILSYNTEFIGFSVNIASINLAGKIATQIKGKNSSKKIIFGGTGCFREGDRKNMSCEDIRNIDAFIIGEGEEVLENLLINKKNNLGAIKGLIYKKRDFYKQGVAHYTEDINKLPFPKFSGFDLGGYSTRQIPMLISRGCIGRCVYCIDYLMCGNYRYRSPNIILEEVKYHLEINKINNFGFNDLICNGNLKQLEVLCDLIIESKISILWGSFAMIRKDMSLELLKKMHKAGCFGLCYGLESGCDTTLKRMNKFYNSSEAERIIKLTHEAGISVALNLIVGFPGETRNDFDETIRFIKRNKDCISEISNISTLVLMFPSKMCKQLKDYVVKPLPLSAEAARFNLYYKDRNKADFYERVKRLRKTVFEISTLGIRNAIVNQPGIANRNNKNSVVLLSLPFTGNLMPSPKLAKIYSHLLHKGFDPLIYDFNIKLYNSVDNKFRTLWTNVSCGLDNSDDGMFNYPDQLLEKIYDLSEEVFSLKANLFYFYIEEETLFFAIKMAYVLKKWLPSIFIIFSNPAFENKGVSDLLPAGIGDMFIFNQEEETLCEILENNISGCISDIANTAFYKNGKYKCNQKKEYSLADEIKITFRGFDLRDYNNPSLTIS